jgi:hypothetical protein
MVSSEVHTHEDRTKAPNFRSSSVKNWKKIVAFLMRQDRAHLIPTEKDPAILISSSFRHFSPADTALVDEGNKLTSHFMQMEKDIAPERRAGQWVQRT